MSQDSLRTPIVSNSSSVDAAESIDIQAAAWRYLSIFKMGVRRTCCQRCTVNIFSVWYHSHHDVEGTLYGSAVRCVIERTGSSAGKSKGSERQDTDKRGDYVEL